MLIDNDRKEQLSYAYVHAVASHAGFGCDRPGIDRDSVDVTVSARGQLVATSILWSPKLDLQLKATACSAITGDQFSFALPMKNYNDLRVDNTHIPRLLVILTLPEDDADWLNHSEEQLALKRCAYWCNLQGSPASDNENTQTVHIARCNVFSPEVLREMLIRVSLQRTIGHAL
ncbi:MAG TPA: DUF4365 domain-containing protein [Chthonomonadaceae bacterium]|nr:DUF4365 domain-containing protein [Chthonomonadaceae bacterium]